MHADVVQACLDLLVGNWRALPSELRPDGFWVVRHPLIADAQNAWELPIQAAWYIDPQGVHRRDPQAAERFLHIQSARSWQVATAPLVRAAFNSRPAGMHAIGLARIGPMPDAGIFYLEYQWGGCFGSGSICRFDATLQRLVEVKSLWMS